MHQTRKMSVKTPARGRSRMKRVVLAKREVGQIPLFFEQSFPSTREGFGRLVERRDIFERNHEGFALQQRHAHRVRFRFDFSGDLTGTEEAADDQSGEQCDDEKENDSFHGIPFFGVNKS
jgi:hypothetical protein